jgi:steroid delta-isomerase-like uncharacterized protein
MAQEYQTLAHEWFEEVWNQGRSEAIERLFAADGVAHGLADLAGNDPVGPDGFKPFHRKLTEAFPDIRIEVEDTVCQGDKIAARCVLTGTHRGETLGMAATGRRVSVTGITILRIEQGKIAEAWNNFDFVGLYRQLGSAGGG